MKLAISLIIVTLTSFTSLAQDKTPVLSEMGSLGRESSAENPAVLAERDTVLRVTNDEKRVRARKMRKKAVISDAKRAEALDNE